MTRPEVERIRRELAIEKLREDEPKPLGEILAALRGYAGEQFAKHGSDPEYDVMPMLHAEGRDGAVVLAAPAGWADDDEKNAMVAVWKEMLGRVSGRAWGMVMTAWGLEREEPDEEGEGDPLPVMDADDPRYLSPRNHPHRQEWAIVQGTDTRRHEMWRAEVIRAEAGVRLTAWEKVIDGPVGIAGGDLVDPFVETVCLSALAEAFRLVLIERPDEWWTDERLAAGDRSLDRAGTGLEGLMGGLFAEAMDDFRTLGLLADKDGVIGLADEVFERAGIEKREDVGA